MGIVTKRSSIFDDRSKENEELTAFVKNDITALKMAISDLETLQNMEIAERNYSGDRVVHLTAVCDDLKNRLMNATKQFQDVLTTRTKVYFLSLLFFVCRKPHLLPNSSSLSSTQNIKAHEDRKQIFSTVVSTEKPLRQPTTMPEPAPWSSSSNTSRGNLHQTV